MIFPIRNDPLPGRARIVSTSQDDSSSRYWIFGAVLGSLLVAGTYFAATRWQQRSAPHAPAER